MADPNRLVRPDCQVGRKVLEQSVANGVTHPLRAIKAGQSSATCRPEPALGIDLETVKLSFSTAPPKTLTSSK